MKDELNEVAFNELLTTLQTQPEFIKVHAAEYLIWLGHKEEARKEFIKENQLHGDQPKYRIGIWRVLAQTEEKAEGKVQWHDKIFGAFADLNGPDRLHAAETLGKLNLSPVERYPEATRQLLSTDNMNLYTYTLWASSHSSKDSLDRRRLEFLDMAISGTTRDVRLISSFILRSVGLNADQWKTFAEAALSEPSTSPVKYSLLCTAVLTNSGNGNAQELYSRIENELLKNKKPLSAGESIELSKVLAEKGEPSEISLLQSFLNNENISAPYEANSKEGADVRAAAAYAILKIDQRQNSRPTTKK